MRIKRMTVGLLFYRKTSKRFMKILVKTTWISSLLKQFHMVVGVFMNLVWHYLTKMSMIRT